MAVNLIEVGQSIVAHPVEKDSSGNVVDIAYPSLLEWSTSNPDIATVRCIGDGSAEFTGVAPGDVEAVVKDPHTGLENNYTFTVTEKPTPTPDPNDPVSVSIEWEEPKPKEVTELVA